MYINVSNRSAVQVDSLHWPFRLGLFVYLLLFYILATSKVISGQVLTYNSAHSWWLYSAASLENQGTNTMTWHPTQSHYPDSEPTNACPILIMLSTWIGSYKYQLWGHWFDSTRTQMPRSPKTWDGRSAIPSGVSGNEPHRPVGMDRGWSHLSLSGHMSIHCVKRYCVKCVQSAAL